MNDLHGIVFACRSDANLGELTRPRNTCSLPFGGRYRLIDFMLSNYVNAGITDVGVIVHQSYQSLLDHVGSGKDWDLSRKHGGLRILPPFGYAERGGEYRGNMDALSGVADYLENIRQDYVILAWGDMAVNLPVAEVFQQHLDSGADVTMVCTPSLKGAPRFSEYVEVDDTGRVTDLSVHPVTAGSTLESLEIYILSKKLLLDMVDYCSAHDIVNFSRGVLQPRLRTLKLMSYVHQGYVARFQSVSGYFQRSMDLLEPSVRDELFNPDRPIRTKDRSNPSTYYGPDSRSVHSLVADGCLIEGEVENSIISRGVIIEKGARVCDSVLMQGAVVRSGASLAYVIADKNVTINQDRMLMGHLTYPLAIAKELGIFRPGDLAVTGEDLDFMPQEMLEQDVEKFSVYARVSPEHKMRIVKAWQKRGKVVAMTGDGVNDAPALKAADIGCAMGLSGTDGAIGASDIILTDDNFATIVSAVEQGRGIYANIKKAIHYLLSCNIGEIITIFFATVLDFAQMPLVPVQLLWLNLVTDSLPALALGMEPVEEGIMKERPRAAHESLFAHGFAFRLASLPLRPICWGSMCSVRRARRTEWPTPWPLPR